MPVVVPAVGSSDQNHPVLPAVLLLGGEGAQQLETEPEQGEEEQLRHVPVPAVGWTPARTAREKPEMLNKVRKLANACLTRHVFVRLMFGYICIFFKTKIKILYIRHVTVRPIM